VAFEESLVQNRPFEIALSPKTDRFVAPVKILLLASFSVIIGLAAITSQSLWMDEGGMVFKALLPNFQAWWEMTTRLGGSDVQMPVYLFLVWAWEKLGASSEYALRCVNLPWIVIATLALGRVRFWPLVLLTSPFMLYYTGEIRPYAMQVAAGAVAALALFRIHAGRDGTGFGGLHTAAAAALFLAGSSLTAAVWAAGLWIGVLVLRPDWLKRSGFWWRLAPWSVAAAIVASYYLYTLLQGYRAAALDGGGIMSILFGCYELLGLAGLGPGRNELRANPRSVISSLPVLLPAVLILVAAWFHGFSTWKRSVSKRCMVAVAIAVFFPLLFFAALGVVMDFRVLGRHLSPMLPAVLLPIAVTLETMGPRKNAWRAIGAMTVGLSLVSAIGLRFMERHARDDYRRATDIAITALKEGKRVWWRADMNAPRYYAYRNGGMPMVNAIQVLESDLPSSLLSTDLVIINRPDLRHRGFDYQSELKRNYFKQEAVFTGFEVWRSE
jgi:hypothetical protein